MRLWRYCAGGFLYDWLVYVAWTVIPIRAEGFGATATQLSLLQASWSGLYIVSSLAMGLLADRVSKPALARLACLLALAACAALSRVADLGGLWLAIPLLSLGASMFWPAVQGAIGVETEPHRMEKALGLFNILWSLGKSLGFLMAGWMTGHLGPAHTMLAAAAAAGAIALFYPWRSGRPAPRSDPAASLDPSAFRLIAYIANFAVYGVGTILQNQFFKFLTATGRGQALFDRATFFGLFLGLIYLAQTAVFWAMQRNAAWAYRRAPLYATQIAVGATVLLVPWVRSDAVLLLLAAATGAALGFSYASSLYYSLHGPSEHGKFSGIHEAVLGAGALLTLASGFLADLFGDLRLPYWIAAGTSLGAVAVQEAVYRTRARSSSNRSILKSAPSSSPGLK